jgi:hypothetical protein
MLNQEIKEKLMRDLNLPERRARMYTKLFSDKFGGNVRAITYVLASYTPSGDINVSYVIENKRYHMTVDGSKPYSRKKKEEQK